MKCGANEPFSKKHSWKTYKKEAEKTKSGAIADRSHSSCALCRNRRQVGDK